MQLQGNVCVLELAKGLIEIKSVNVSELKIYLKIINLLNQYLLLLVYLHDLYCLIIVQLNVIALFAQMASKNARHFPLTD